MLEFGIWVWGRFEFGFGFGSVWVWVWGRLGFGHLVRFRVTGLAARWSLVSVMARVSLGVKVTAKVRVRIRVRIRVRVRVRVGVSSWLGTSAMIERTAPPMSSSSAPCTTWHSKPCAHERWGVFKGRGTTGPAHRAGTARAHDGESAVRLGGAHRDCEHQQADPNPNPNPNP